MRTEGSLVIQQGVAAIRRPLPMDMPELDVLGVRSKIRVSEKIRVRLAGFPKKEGGGARSEI